jgi:hypothetical protein
MVEIGNITPTTKQAGDRFIVARGTSPAQVLLDDVLGASFETVSKNLQSYGATLVYSSGNLATMTYSNGVVKTLNYTGDTLTSVILSGAVPNGIALTKTFSYSGDDVSSYSYS